MSTLANNLMLSISNNRVRKPNPLQDTMLIKQERKNSFITTPDLQTLTKKREKIKTKVVNTQVPKSVFTAFLMYCAQENRFRKEVFPDMLQHLLRKCESQHFKQIGDLNGNRVNFIEVINVNFEFDLELLIKVKQLKAREHVKFQSIYTQAIIQYMNDNKLEIKA